MRPALTALIPVQTLMPLQAVGLRLEHHLVAPRLAMRPYVHSILQQVKQLGIAIAFRDISVSFRRNIMRLYASLFAADSISM